MADTLDSAREFGRITAETCAELRALWPVVEPAVPRILDIMYAHILNQADLKALFVNQDRIDGARKRQAQHWQRLFAGVFDGDYVASVERIAATHARIGLQPSFYISTYLIALEEIHALIVDTFTGRMMGSTGRKRVSQAIQAVDRAVLFDLQLVVTAYLAETGVGFRSRLEALADQFGEAINGFTGTLNTSAGTLTTNAEFLLGSANSTSAEASALSETADQSSSNMQAVASAAEEITASIGEITRQTQQAADNTAVAVTTVGRAGEIVETLNTTATRIGDVVNLIQSIAGQTNLLALNATIEAARAGDAGKGFAVVAGEVKALSAQTAKATDDIRVQVNAVQGVVSQIADAMTDIAQAVDRIRETTGAIADAVDQQGQATQEISRSAAAAAAGAADMTDGARKVLSIAEQTAANARDVSTASVDLREGTARLSQQSGMFMEKIRTADRREQERYPIDAEATLTVDGTILSGRLRDISAGGAQIRADAAKLPPNPTVIVLRIPGSPVDTRVRIVGSRDSVINLAFVNPVDGDIAVRWFVANRGPRSKAA